MKLFCYKNRPVHLGPYPLERLRRQREKLYLAAVPEMKPVSYVDEVEPESLTNAMTRYIGMLDVVRDGTVTPAKAEMPDDPQERSDHLKAAAYYYDATMMGVCELPKEALLAEPMCNPAVAGLAAKLEKGQPKTFAAGIDVIYADVLESARKQLGPVDHHTHAIVMLVEYTRDPSPDEPGKEWFHDAQAQRAGVLAANTAVLLSSHIPPLGYETRDFHMGAYPFEKLKRVETPTTFIDEPRVPRFPKILPMSPNTARAKKSARLHYSNRRRADVGFLAELAAAL